ncbi:MAG: hypothetical protein KDD64_02780 [Bdellovibrionales bacterium]|nr:hypothetical protein [Bdellovibrionales bacterium]
MRISRFAAACVFVACQLSQIAHAESSDLSSLQKSVEEMKIMLQSLQTTVSRQQGEIEKLRYENESLKSSNVPQEVHSLPPAQSSGSSKQAQYLPDIGVVADVVGLSSESRDDEEGNDRFSVRDFEIVFGHDIDPYSRLDATVVFSDEEDPELEEAYASFWDFPFDSQLRFGRLKPKVGIVSAMHRDSLDTVDVPLVIQRYLGAEGLSKTGADVTGYVPLPFDSFTQALTFGVLEGGNGEEGQLFGETKRIPTFYARLKNAVDVSDETSVDLGASWLNGSIDDDSGREANSVGLDFTLTHFVSPTQKLKLQSEAFIVDRDLPGASEESEEEDLTYLSHDNPWGYYVLADYRFDERWGVGSRWDWVEPIATELDVERDHENALSTYLTFYQSEFARWRFQYQRAEGIDDVSDNRFFLQGTFAIGTHKHQIQ